MLFLLPLSWLSHGQRLRRLWLCAGLPGSVLRCLHQPCLLAYQAVPFRLIPLMLHLVVPLLFSLSLALSLPQLLPFALHWHHDLLWSLAFVCWYPVVLTQLSRLHVALSLPWLWQWRLLLCLVWFRWPTCQALQRRLQPGFLLLALIAERLFWLSLSLMRQRPCLLPDSHWCLQLPLKPCFVAPA